MKEKCVPPSVSSENQLKERKKLLFRKKKVIRKKRLIIASKPSAIQKFHIFFQLYESTTT